jgi:hypothetical protein
MSDHRHLVHGQPSRALALAWCQCGAELQLERDRWRDPPKTLEGKTRRQAWAARVREDA